MTVTEPGVSIDERLATALRTGTWLDLIPDIPAGGVLDEEMRSWGAEHDVDAELVRDLLLRSGLEDAETDPRGLRLRGVRIRGRLDLDLVDTTVALELIDCMLDHGVTVKQAHLPVLRMQRCRLDHPGMPAFVGDGLRVDGDLVLDAAVITAESKLGAVRLEAAQIGGQLGLRSSDLRNPAGPVLHADRVQIGGDALLDEGFTAEGTGDGGVVRLAGAKIGGRLLLRGATLRNSNGRALHADRLQAGGGALLDEGFTAEGTGDDGATVMLPGARIGSNLSLRGATLRNPTGPALLADCLVVETGGTVFLDKGFTAEGGGSGGAVRLLAARIGGQLILSGATLRNTHGPGLWADRLWTGDQAFLNEGFTVEGAGAAGAVRLLGARIGGQLDLRDATVRNPNGPALYADQLQTGGSALLDEGFTAEGAIRLPGARIDGRLALANGGLQNQSDPRNRWEADGLTYRGVPRLDGVGNRDAWLELLRKGTLEYAAQPYQQLAAAYRAEGHDSDVRRILMAQRRDEIARGGLSWADRLWSRTTGVLLGYGYQPWRALLYLASVLTISVSLALWLGGQGGLTRTIPATAAAAPTAAGAAQTPPAWTLEASTLAPTSCTLVQTIGRGLDLGAPFLPAAATAVGSCQPTASVAGEALTVARWALQLLAWALAALFIAGFTGIVRKT